MNKFSAKLATIALVLIVGCQPITKKPTATPPVSNASATTQNTNSKPAIVARANDGMPDSVKNWVGITESRAGEIITPPKSTNTIPVQSSNGGTSNQSSDVKPPVIKDNQPATKPAVESSVVIPPKLDPTNTNTVNNVDPTKSVEPSHAGPAHNTNNNAVPTPPTTHLVNVSPTTTVSPATKPVSEGVSRPAGSTTKLTSQNVDRTGLPANAVPIGRITPHAAASQPATHPATQSATAAPSTSPVSAIHPTTQELVSNVHVTATTTPAPTINQWLSTTPSKPITPIVVPATAATSKATTTAVDESSDTFSLIFAIGVPILLFLLWLMIKNRTTN